ncbi:MAG: methylated-DNA--[protein]-cysteine S-methyltransferase [Saprospiraceae bacterium]
MHSFIRIEELKSDVIASINTVDTRLGNLSIVSIKDSILFCSFFSANFMMDYAANKFPDLRFEDSEFGSIDKVKEFVDGKFDTQIKLLVHGTDFQIKVWSELLKIPYGKTTSYKKIAQALDNLKAIRAVGAAIGSNEHAILIPCHRVLYHDGSSGHFKWGADLKKKLLGIENPKLIPQKELF